MFDVEVIMTRDPEKSFWSESPCIKLLNIEVAIPRDSGPSSVLKYSNYWKPVRSQFSLIEIQLECIYASMRIQADFI